MSFNLNYTFGSLAGIALVIQLLSGLLLTMHYVPNTELAFASVEHIMRDINGGAFLRYMHANGASFFFFSLYWHIGRALYYKSYVKNTAAWFVGIIIFVAVMAAGFFGYVLPWGQMSFWGATVITNLFSAIPMVGDSIVTWLWGGFGVGGPTLNRFYTFHFLIPFIILALVVVHLFFLHNEGSTTPHLLNHGTESISLGQYFIHKDLLLGGAVLLWLFMFILFEPNELNHPDNYIPANPMQTPAHIVPEWYLLPFYAILRTIPNKGLGIVAMGLSMAFLAVLPAISSNDRGIATSSFYHKAFFWVFVVATLMLGFLGAQAIEFPYTTLSIFFSVVYFSYVPVLVLWTMYSNYIFTSGLKSNRFSSR